MKNAIAKEPFGRHVQEVAQDYQPDLRWQASAIAVLHESAEHYAIRLM